MDGHDGRDGRDAHRLGIEDGTLAPRVDSPAHPARGGEEGARWR